MLAGYPVVDIKVTLFDGSYHDVDSNEMAFKIAGSMGFKEGCRKAKPVLLEPIMKVEVVTPEDFLGDIIGDLHRRRGQVQGTGRLALGQDRARRSAAGRDVRLCHLHAFRDPGSRHVFHGVREVHGDPGQRGRSGHQESILSPNH